MSRRLLGRWLLVAALVALAVVGVVLLASGGGSNRGRPARSTPTARPAIPQARSTPTTRPATPQPPAAGAPSGDQLGVSVNYLFNTRSYSSGEIASQLEAVRRTGATIARTDALWEAAEPSPPTGGHHHYDWSFDDHIAGSLALHGLRWLPILDYTAIWDQSVTGEDHSAPLSDADFADFAAAFARRYGAGGSFWRARPGLAAEAANTYEIWNEPDNKEFWLPQPNAGAYAQLYLQARGAIVAVDPGSRVIIGGLTNPGVSLPAMLAARPDLAGRVDGVAIHPYGPNPFVVFGRVRGARTVLGRLGMSRVPLYVTEVGWTTSPPHSLSWAPAKQRPGFIKATLDVLGHSNCRIASIVLYTWVSPELNPSNHEDWFGIHPPHGTGTTPDTDAFTAGVSTARASGKTVNVCPA